MGLGFVEVRALRDVSPGESGGQEPQRHHADHGQPPAGDEESWEFGQHGLVGGCPCSSGRRVVGEGPVRGFRREVGGIAQSRVLREDIQRRQDRQVGIGPRCHIEDRSRRGRGEQEPVLRVREGCGGHGHRRPVVHEGEVLPQGGVRDRQRSRGVGVLAPGGEADRSEDVDVRSGCPRGP